METMVLPEMSLAMTRGDWLSIAIFIAGAIAFGAIWRRFERTCAQIMRQIHQLDIRTIRHTRRLDQRVDDLEERQTAHERRFDP